MPSKKIKVPDFYYQEMTAAGYRQIEDQIEALKKQRPEKIARLKAARALGDLSENTEYSTAKRDLRHLESRLRYLNKQLTYAKIITPQDTGKLAWGPRLSYSMTMTMKLRLIRWLGGKKPIFCKASWHLTRHWAKQLPGSAREILPWLPRRRENIRLKSFPSG